MSTCFSSNMKFSFNWATFFTAHLLSRHLPRRISITRGLLIVSISEKYRSRSKKKDFFSLISQFKLSEYGLSFLRRLDCTKQHLSYQSGTPRTRKGISCPCGPPNDDSVVTKMPLKVPTMRSCQNAWIHVKGRRRYEWRFMRTHPIHSRA